MSLPPPPDGSDVVQPPDDDPLPAHKVGILGAGIGGLYAALILDSLDIAYEILEASDRVGGRVSTYHFPGGDTYDYYDVGAMRFPFPKKDSRGRYHDGMMKRLAELTEYAPLNHDRDRLRDRVVPCYFHARDGTAPGVHYFNGIREPISKAHNGHFGAPEMGVGAEYIRAGAGAITSDVVRPFVEMLLEDIKTGKKDGWEALLAYDSYSHQAYMATKYVPSPHLELPPRLLPRGVLNWCGLLGRVGDNGLVEAVLQSLVYPYSGDAGDYTCVEWKCFEAGAETLTKKIEEYLNRQKCAIHLGKRVTAISQGYMISPDHLGHRNEDKAEREQTIASPSVVITVNAHEKREYSHVISTLPLPVLHSTIDLTGAGLSIMQKNALRSLRYLSCLKVAILFKSNWWTTKLGIVGGQTVTDLPIAKVVYPSYGVDSSAPSKVLVASYCSNADADRIAALATPRDREMLKVLVLRNLAEVHDGLHPNITYEYLSDQFIDMHVKDWSRDGYAMGAYAFFGPGQFRDLYPSLTSPTAGERLHFAGEAVSLRHGWVVGALDSSWRAVRDYLKVTGQDEKMTRFMVLWGQNSEWTTYGSPGDDG